MYIRYITLILLGICSTSMAQRAKTICGEYTYFVPEDISDAQAKITAVERAKISALANEFGTTISQNNTTIIQNKNEQSTINFFSLSSSDVQGEWIENIGEPKYIPSYDRGCRILKVSVCGKAREILRAKIDFTAKILRNTPELKFESEQFRNGDNIYLYFQSPIKGFLAVYLIDDAQTAYCLLPYMKIDNGKQPIQNNKPYYFFSQQKAELSDVANIDEYVLTCEQTKEYNWIYIIFSPNEFSKANDQKGNQQLPRQLSFQDFQKWITNSLNRDKNMQLTKKLIEITK